MQTLRKAQQRRKLPNAERYAEVAENKPNIEQQHRKVTKSADFEREHASATNHSVIQTILAVSNACSSAVYGVASTLQAEPDYMKSMPKLSAASKVRVKCVKCPRKPLIVRRSSLPRARRHTLASAEEKISGQLVSATLTSHSTAKTILHLHILHLAYFDAYFDARFRALIVVIGVSLHVSAVFGL